MSIIGLPSVGGASGSGFSLRSSTTGNGSNSGGSPFGPAYVLGGGSGQNFAAGLYSQLGQSLSRPSPAISASSDLQAEERLNALRSAADKIDQGDIEGGRAEAQALLDKNEQDVAALAVIGRSYVSEQDYDQAERFYARAAGLSPQSARLQNDLSHVRTLKKSDEEVIRSARQKIAAPNTRFEGLRLLLLLSERSPDNTDAFLELADGFEKARKPVEVLGALQEALRVAGDDELGEVIDRARTFVGDHPRVGLGHNILGRALQRAGRFDEGLRELQAAEDAAPDNISYVNDVAGGFVARARDAIDGGRLTSGKSDLDKAFAINPQDPGYREAAGRLALARGEKEITGYRYNRALLELNRAYSAGPDDAAFRKRLANAYTRVARFYHNRDDTNLALEAYRKAYDLDPTSTPARRNMAELSHEKGLDFRSKGIYVTAIDHLDRAYQADRTNDAYRTDLAIAYDLQGQELQRRDKLDEAIEHFEKSFALDPTNTDVGTRLSEALNQRAGN